MYDCMYYINYYAVYTRIMADFFSRSLPGQPFHACSCVGTFTTGLRGRAEKMFRRRSKRKTFKANLQFNDIQRRNISKYLEIF